MNLYFDTKKPLWPSVRVEEEPELPRFTISFWGWTYEAGPSIASIRGYTRECVINMLARMPATTGYIQAILRKDAAKVKTTWLPDKPPINLDEFFLWKRSGYSADGKTFLPAVWLPALREQSKDGPPPTWWPDPKKYVEIMM